MGWLNSWASQNAPWIVKQLSRFQLSSGWLNEVAFRKIPWMVVTADVSQLLMFWLNAVAAPANLRKWKVESRQSPERE